MVVRAACPEGVADAQELLSGLDAVREKKKAAADAQELSSWLLCFGKSGWRTLRSHNKDSMVWGYVLPTLKSQVWGYVLPTLRNQFWGYMFCRRSGIIVRVRWPEGFFFFADAQEHVRGKSEADAQERRQGLEAPRACLADAQELSSGSVYIFPAEWLADAQEWWQSLATPEGMSCGRSATILI